MRRIALFLLTALFCLSLTPGALASEEPAAPEDAEPIAAAEAAEPAETEEPAEPAEPEEPEGEPAPAAEETPAEEMPEEAPAEEYPAEEDAPDAEPAPITDGDTYGTVLGSGDFETYDGKVFHWSLSRGGVLTITGTGELTDLPDYYDIYVEIYGPNSDETLYIKEVYFAGGVTSAPFGSVRFSGVDESEHKTIRVGGAVKEYAGGGDGEADTVILEEGVERIKLVGLNVRRVVLSSTVKSIGSEAFRKLPRLESVEVASSSKLETIGENAFYGCKSLTAIDLGACKHLREIGRDAFMGCTALESVELPASLETTGDYVFSNCTALHTVAIHGGSAFGGFIGKVFNDCSMLESVTIDGDTSSLGNSMFEDCKKLERVDMSNSKITEISSYAFRNCVSLEDVKFSPCLLKIGADAFANCVVLREIDLPETLEELSGFNGCTELQTVTVPDSVTRIYDCFNSCAALREVVVGNGVKEIQGWSFVSCPKLEKITLGQSLEKIGDNCLQRLEALRELVLPDSLTSIGRDVFGECPALKTLTLGAGITSYDSFCYNTYYHYINMPRSVENVYVSEKSEALKSVDGVVYTADGETLFWYPGSHAATDYEILPGTKTIGKEAFEHLAVGSDGGQELAALRTLTIPGSVRFIEDYWYAGWFPALTDVYYNGTEEAFQAILRYEEYPDSKPLDDLYKSHSDRITFHFADILPGDADGNGVVDRQDRIYIARYLAGWSGYELTGDALTAADVNNDGAVDRQDRIHIARYLAGWSGYEL